MQTAANPTPRTVPEFLTGRPMQSRENPVSQEIPNIESMNKTSQSVQENASNDTSADPIKHLADVLVRINNEESAQTLMVRPVITTTLTSDGKSEKS